MCMFNQLFGFMNLFFYKFRNRLRFAFDFADISKHTDSMKQSCRKCGKETYTDFVVTDNCWKRVTILTPYTETSLCLDCFLELTADSYIRLYPEDFIRIDAYINHKWEPLIKEE